MTQASLKSGDEIARKSFDEKIWDFVAVYGIAVILLLVVAMAASVNQNFFGFANIRNIFSQNAAIALVAIGATFVLIGGGFDLSAGAMFALGSVTYALLAVNGVPLVPAVIVTLFAGLVLGVCNGLLVNVLGVNPLVATLGSSSMITGLAFILSDSAPIMARGIEGFDLLGRGRLGGITYSTYLMVFMFFAMSFVLHSTTFGRNVFAIGGNREAARLAGVRTSLISISTYALSGVFAILGGIVIASRASVGQANVGGDITLTAITMVILGGTTLLGGEGAIWRTFVGVMILATLRNMFDTLSLSNAAQLFAQGAILVSAVALDAFVRSRRS